MTVRGGGGGIGLSAGTQVALGGIVSYSNGGGLTLGLNNGTLTGSVAATASAGLNGILAGTQTASSGSVSLANSNGITFGMSNSSIVTASYNSTQFAGTGTTFAGTNASASVTLNSAGLNMALSAAAGGGGVALSAAGSSQSSGTLVFSNANSVSFGMNGSTVTASVPNFNTANLGTATAGTNITWTANSSGLSINAAGYAGTGTTFAGTNVSGSMTVNSAGVNLALSGAAAGTGGASSGAVYLAGNTTGQSSSSTYALSGLNVSGSGVVSVGWSSNSLIISAPGTTSLGQLSAGISGGNTSGNTGTVAQGQIVFAGGNNVTLSGSTNGSSMTVTISAGTASGNPVNFSAGTTSGNLGSVVFSNSNGVSFGLNGSTITASAAGGGGGVNFGVSTAGNTAGSTGTVSTGNVVLVGSGPISLSQSTGAAGSAATITINAPATSSLAGTNGISVSVNGSTISVSQLSPAVYLSSNTTAQSSSSAYPPPNLTMVGMGNVSLGWSSNGLVVSGGTVAGQPVNFSAGTTSGNLGSVVFSNSNGVSFGLNGSTITASAGAAFSGGVSGGNTSGNTGITGSALAFAGGNNITLSQATGTGGATITVSAANLASTAAYYFGGNTTGQSSSSTGGDQTISISAAGIISGGWSNSSLVLSATAPAVSSLVGTNGISLSSNGSTISISAVSNQKSFYQAWPFDNSTLTQHGNGSVMVYPANGAPPFSASRADIMASISLTNLAVSTEAQALSLYVGVYSLNGSTLSMASSGSQSYAWTNNSAGSNASISGLRRFSVPINVNHLGANDIFVAMMSSTTFSNTQGITISNVAVPQGPDAQLQGLIGQVPASSMQFVPGQGAFSVTSGALPGSMGISQIYGIGSGTLAANFSPVQFANLSA